MNNGRFPKRPSCIIGSHCQRGLDVIYYIEFPRQSGPIHRTVAEEARLYLDIVKRSRRLRLNSSCMAPIWQGYQSVSSHQMLLPGLQSDLQTAGYLAHVKSSIFSLFRVTEKDRHPSSKLKSHGPPTRRSHF